MSSFARGTPETKRLLESRPSQTKEALPMHQLKLRVLLAPTHLRVHLVVDNKHVVCAHDHIGLELACVVPPSTLCLSSFRAIKVSPTPFRTGATRRGPARYTWCPAEVYWRRRSSTLGLIIGR